MTFSPNLLAVAGKYERGGDFLAEFIGKIVAGKCELVGTMAGRVSLALFLAEFKYQIISHSALEGLVNDGLALR